MRLEAPKLSVAAYMVITRNCKDTFFRPEIPREEILMTRIGRRRRGRSRKENPSEEIVTVGDLLGDLIGDGKGVVAVPMDFGEKDFGNGYGAGLVVSLTCDQSEEKLEQAKDACLAIQRRFLPEIADTAHELFTDKVDRNPLPKTRR